MLRAHAAAGSLSQPAAALQPLPQRQQQQQYNNQQRQRQQQQ